MPDENGTATTRPDAPSVDETLFGDPAEKADDAPAAVVEGQDGDEGGAQGGQNPGPTEDDSGTTEELKVVVSVRGGRATIGVQQPASDPHIETFDDADLHGLAQEVPGVTERARARWEESPKYPAHVKPAPPAARRPRRGQGTAQTAAAGSSDQQQAEVLRLF